MKLQACMFLRTSKKSADVNQKKGQHWESGFAKVQTFGVSNVDWIIDSQGNKVSESDLWDYQLLNHNPGHLATNE